MQTQEQLLKKIIRYTLLEYVVPIGFSLERWKGYRKKHGITNADYHREHPEKKWKVVHGHKKGEIGKPLPGLNKISYNKATKAHSAIAMNEQHASRIKDPLREYLNEPKVKEFKNELGNEIIITIEDTRDTGKRANSDDVEEFDAIKITMEGPTSTSENTITKIEAQELHKVLTAFLNETLFEKLGNKIW